MAQMLLVNPRRKRRKGGTRKRRRAMTAKQLKYFGPRRKRRRSRSRVAALASSPVARRRSRRVSKRRSRRSSGGSRMGRLSFNPKTFINETLMPAGIGAAGALALDAALSFASPYIPAGLNTGIARTGIKLAGAIAVGMAASMIGGKKLGEQVMVGGVIVTMYDFLKPYAAGVVPGVAGYDMGWVSPAPQIGAYVGTDNAYGGGMGTYISESEEDYYASKIYA